VNTEPVYGNKILYFETSGPASGELPFARTYSVERREVRGLDVSGERQQLPVNERKRFLSANSKVPLQGKPLNLLDGIKFPRGPLAMARTLYDRVDDHVRYDKSRPGYGNGDVLWVCDSRFGNCTDFHSLFISLARSKGLPARFEIGLPLPTERGTGNIGGYHCWALFHTDDRGWVPVDISEADKHPGMKDYYFGNLTENRVAFSVGRDIELVPRQNGKPLNYFVYPYVEVDGRVWPRDRIKLSLSYSDTPRTTTP
jgi:transglutaminase-like putative cysteine protease